MKPIRYEAPSHTFRSAHFLGCSVWWGNLIGWGFGTWLVLGHRIVWDELGLRHVWYG